MSDEKLFVLVCIVLGAGFFVGTMAGHTVCPLLSVKFGEDWISVANWNEAKKMCAAVDGQLFCGPDCICAFHKGEPYG